MRTIPLVVVTGLVVFLAGCTPPADDVLRRWNGAAGSLETVGGHSPRGRIQRDSAYAVQFARLLGSRDPTRSELVDGQTREVIRVFGPIIKQYAKSYRLDWRLVLATMKQESRFLPSAESHKGARGLMQIMPLTAEEITERLDLTDLEDPQNNIHGGVYYLRRLYDLYVGASEGDRIKLTLAAYNAGLGRISDAQELATHLELNPMEWKNVRDVLPLLSRRHRDLHENVWQQERPRSGWFGNSRETIAYVEGVMNHYDEYRLALN